VHGNLVHRLQGKRGSAAQTETRLSWDAAHQLVQAQVTRGVDGDSSLDETQTQTRATTQTYHYGYDALGRRVFKADAFGTTVFAWDGDQQVLELRGASQNHTIYQPNSFVPLAQVHNGHLHHLHTDHLGTPLEASNDAGELTWRVTYRTWGNVVREEWEEGIASGLGSEADADPGQRRITQNLRFQGQYFDAETGLHYNRFRYYDPTVGRFVSNDPIGLSGGTNLYQYAPNPIKWIDPWGLIGEMLGNASELPVIKSGTKEWDAAVKAIQEGGKTNFRVSCESDAEKLLRQAKTGIKKMPTYCPCPYKKGYELHPNESHTQNAPQNDLPHIKWKDWECGKKSGGAGHIFYE
jgi:RHS repeat-associated protein